VPFRPCAGANACPAVVAGGRTVHRGKSLARAAVGSIAFAALGLMFDSSLREDLLGSRDANAMCQH